MKGMNDLASTHPDLAAQWHPTKNGAISPSDVMAGTSQSIWWLCKEGHEWEAKGYSRSSMASGCPFCAGQRVIAGKNDLQTQYPKIAQQWHPTKNELDSPSQIIAGTHKKFWWLCDLGHEWRVAPVSRIAGHDCPFCAGKAVLAGFNDLATTDVDLANEWHPTKNGALFANGVIRGSHKKAWWLCDLGHEWQAVIGSRASGRGCPFCAGRQVLQGFNDLATTNPDLAAQWHPEKNQTLTPQVVSRGTSRAVWWIGTCGHDWKATIPDRALSGAGCPYCSGQATLEGFNDLASTHPELLAEWHPTRNGTLSPREIIAGTSRKIWWVCQQGHEWQANGNNRVTRTGCPTCASTGFDPNKPAVVYFIAHRSLQARKIGITNIGTTRLVDFARNGWEILKLFEHGDGSRIVAIEFALLSWLRNDRQMPTHLTKRDMRQTGGWTETFSMEGPSDAEVIARIEHEFSAFNQLKTNVSNQKREIEQLSSSP